MTKFTNVIGSAVGSASQIDSLVVDYNAIVNANNAFINTIVFGTPNPQGILLDSQRVVSRSNNKTILTLSSIENFQVTGTRSNDILIGADFDRNMHFDTPFDDDQLNGADGDDYLYGRAGDDVLSGGNGNDTLIGGTGKDEMHGGAGNDILYGGAGDWLEDGSGINHFHANEADRVTANSQTTLHADYSSYSGTGIVAFHTGGPFNTIQNGIGGVLNYEGSVSFDIKGSQNSDRIGDGFDFLSNDTLVGNGGNDVINGGFGNDSITGDDGHDNIKGDSGNDTITGSNGNDTLDGGNGSDIIDGGVGDDQLLALFKVARTTIEAASKVPDQDVVKGGDGNDVIYAIAGVDGANKQLFGGDGADQYILDVHGEAGTLGFNFNTNTLANFVNAATLPTDTGLDLQQLGIHLGFQVVGAGLGAIPVIGPVLDFMTGLAETGYGTFEEIQAQQDAISAQVANAQQAALTFTDADWGKITTNNSRDVIIINDFKIGIDSILLPRLPPNAFYQIQDASADGLNGVYISIKQQSSGIEQLKSVAFIANNYSAQSVGANAKPLTDSEFESAIRELLVNSEIGTFSKTTITGENTVNAIEVIKGSFANDVVNAQGGNDEVFGNYGNDVLKGGEGHDIIFGGSNQNSAFLQYERTASNPNAPYLNDGNDFISGGEGNDSLYGESGNDFINGDAYNEESGAIGNGNDSLYGGTGNDSLEGGAGSDRLEGGEGFDSYIFNSPLDGSIDIISGFNPVEDTIQLDSLIFSAFSNNGILADNFIANSLGLANDSNDFLILNTVNGALSYDADGNDIGEAIQFAQIELVGGTVPTLSAADFVLA